MHFQLGIVVFINNTQMQRAAALMSPESSFGLPGCNDLATWVTNIPITMACMLIVQHKVIGSFESREFHGRNNKMKGENLRKRGCKKIKLCLLLIW